MNRLESLGNIPLDFGVLARSLGNYKAPKDKVNRLVNEGKFIRLKKGLFVLSPEISGVGLSKELVANHLNGPSYISMESALHWYGLIPERVITVKSATMGRAKSYDTPLGTFEYYKVPSTWYPEGVRTEVIEDSYAFLIATPEKALCDLILTSQGLRIQSEKAMREYLVEDLRMDLSDTNFREFGVIERLIPIGRKSQMIQILNKVLTHG